jgi:hypothetical protein
MKAWIPLLLVACRPDSTCGVEGENPQGIAVFQITEPQGDFVLELVPALPTWDSFENLILTDQAWLEVPATSNTVELNLDTAPSLLAENNEARGILLVPALFRDQNGDGIHSSDEPYLGLSNKVLGYFESVGCGAWADIAQTGWNGIDLSGVSPESWDLESFSLEQELASNDQISVSLTLDESEGLRVVLAPELIWLDEFLVAPLRDQAAAPSMTFELTKSPPENHLQAFDVTGERFLDWFYTVELPLVYTDDDLSGHFSLEDSLETALCEINHGDSARIAHFPEPDTLQEAFYMKTQPFQAGWGLYLDTTENGWHVVDPTEVNLSAGDCPLPTP